MTTAAAGTPPPGPRRGVRWRLLLALITAALAGAAVALAGWVRFGPREVTVSAGTFAEELVYVRTSDDVIHGGAFFASSRDLRKPAVIWVHGWGTHFYSPTYTMVARALAARGLTTITVNTRMHDLGNSATHRNGRRVRGGGYWGITSEQTLDIAAWIDFAEQRGVRRVVLVGHSAGWAAVAAYQVERQDPRVAGLVLASGAVQPLRPHRDPALLERARALVGRGAGDDLLRLPNRNFPSFISAGTYLDMADGTPSLLDFFGVERRDAALTHLRRPLLAFFGTRGDVGGEPDLEVVRSAPRRLSSPAIQVETAMIGGADHMYTGEEAQVAGVIATWVDRVVTPASPPRAP